MNELKAFHVANIGFTVLCLFWQFPLIKSQKVQAIFKGKQESVIEKNTEMPSEVKCPEALFCSG